MKPLALLSVRVNRSVWYSELACEVVFLNDAVCVLTISAKVVTSPLIVAVGAPVTYSMLALPVMLAVARVVVDEATSVERANVAS